MAYNPGTPQTATKIGKQLYSVPSFRGEETAYVVDLAAETCTCPHWTNRLADQQHRVCKHINQAEQQHLGDLLATARALPSVELARLLHRHADRQDIAAVIEIVLEARDLRAQA